ncbi:MAG: hypothetical protein HKN21_08170 [Candidatus Eisenbacteria bacterium]|uniref:Polysaccharide biosynthesis protein C-terminal domain-containing protein n=1 Tax=Eiseniibacteriota bacterium TaxID=2212470 RepID=A0A7Y2E7P6_UNCEI|nr:hypothetical protein [Candidatus Eisenbacteria bacterium]
MIAEPKTTPLTYGRVIKTWWPLAASWALMGFELPVVSAIMARLLDPVESLAAYGGIVFPLALMIEGPVIMLLAASTALSKDWASYRLMYRFMMGLSFALTAIHAAIAFTPLYDALVIGFMKAPESIHEPGRIGLQIMTPWTWAIAYRRFQQGVLIRYGHSGAVGIGTLARLITNVSILAIGYWLGNVAGIVVGTAAVGCGVVAEAVYVGFRVRPVIREQLKPAKPLEVPLTMKKFLAFYVPLALTPLITLTAQPISALSINRMPMAVESLAVIPVINGLSFFFRSFGFAYNEVVVALADYARPLHKLTMTACTIALGVTTAMVLFAATPLGDFYLGPVSNLKPMLVDLGKNGLWFVLFMPALSVFLHFFQGILVHSGRTIAVTEAVFINFVTMVTLLIVGIKHGAITGLYVGLGAHLTGNVLQTAWLWFRSRKSRLVFHRAALEESSNPKIS